MDQVEEASIVFVQAARNYHDLQSMETGIDFDNYVRQKIENKRKGYNAGINEPLNGRSHPADIAVTKDLKRRAQDYRRAKDGE